MKDCDDASLADVLAAVSTCMFDVAEYVQSTAYRERLRRADRRLCDGSTCRSPMALAADIVAAIRDRFASQVPGYHDHATIKQFSDLPLIDKHEVIRDRFRYVNVAFDVAQLWCSSTFGTTGAPATFFADPGHYFEQLLLTLPKIARRAGLIDYRPFRTLSLNLGDVRSSGTRVVLHPDDAYPPMLQTIIAHGNPEAVTAALAPARLLRPAIVSSRPELFAEMLAVCDPRAAMGDHRPACLVSSGSELSATLRAELETAFQVPVINVYALAEFGFVAAQCMYRGALHLDAGLLAEVVDTVGTPAPEGTEGDLVLSSVRNIAMPLVRYRTGDRAVLGTSRCDCGYEGLSIERLAGRSVPLFQIPSLGTVSPSHLNGLLSRFPITQFQITQRTPSAFEVQIEQRAQADNDEAELLADVENFVRDVLGGDIDVVASAGTFTYGPGKFARYRSLVGNEQPI